MPGDTLSLPLGTCWAPWHQTAARAAASWRTLEPHSPLGSLFLSLQVWRWD